MERELYPMCAKCTKRSCYAPVKVSEKPPMEEAPPFCSTRLKPDVISKAWEEYQRDEVREFARLASLQEAQCYERTSEGIRTLYPRVEEVIQFSRKIGAKKLGVAFCIGLLNEARTLERILESNGFQVVSVACKVGAIPKEQLGLKPEEKIRGPDAYESMCNPIAQAEILNSEKVDFVILMGLCVGHDTLFIKYCKLPMTVLAVKDRVLGHNPLAALYLSSSYYRRLMRESPG